MRNGRDYKKIEEGESVEKVKGDSGVDIGVSAHEMRRSLFHPWSGDLADPNGVDGEKRDDRLYKYADSHKYMIAGCIGSGN